MHDVQRSQYRTYRHRPLMSGHQSVNYLLFSTRSRSKRLGFVQQSGQTSNPSSSVFSKSLTTRLFRIKHAITLIAVAFFHLVCESACMCTGGEELFALPLTEYPDLEKTRKVHQTSRDLSLKNTWTTAFLVPEVLQVVGRAATPIHTSCQAGT